MFPPSRYHRILVDSNFPLLNTPSDLPEKFTACPSLFSARVLSALQVRLGWMVSKSLYLLAFSLLRSCRVGVGWFQNPLSAGLLTFQGDVGLLPNVLLACLPNPFSTGLLTSQGGGLVPNPASSVPPVALILSPCNKLGDLCVGVTPEILQN